MNQVLSRPLYGASPAHTTDSMYARRSRYKNYSNRISILLSEIITLQQKEIEFDIEILEIPGLMKKLAHVEGLRNALKQEYWVK